MNPEAGQAIIAGILKTSEFATIDVSLGSRTPAKQRLPAPGRILWSTRLASPSRVVESACFALNPSSWFSATENRNKVTQMARRCSKDELLVWNKFAEKLEPLRPEENFEHETRLSGSEEFADREIGRGAQLRGIDLAEIGKSKAVSKDRQVQDRTRRMDRKLRNRMIKGKIEPESFIDLHGKNRREAEVAVSKFIHSAYRAGHRLVLVITGKGKKEMQEAGFALETGGILKNQVAQQLAARPLSDCILEFHSAHPRHGGGGAYYVYLKRRKNY